MEEKKEEFIFVDKRRKGDTEDIGEKRTFTENADEEVDEEKLVEDLKVINLSRGFFSFLSQIAWCSLGFAPHPSTGKISKDIEEAKLAIDTANSVFEAIKNNLSEDEKKQFRVILSDLKINYARISNEKV